MTYSPAPRHEVVCPRCGRTAIVSYFADAIPTHRRPDGLSWCEPVKLPAGVDGVTLSTIQAVGADVYEQKALAGRGGQA